MCIRLYHCRNPAKNDKNTHFKSVSFSVSFKHLVLLEARRVALVYNNRDNSGYQCAASECEPFGYPHTNRYPDTFISTTIIGRNCSFAGYFRQNENENARFPGRAWGLSLSLGFQAMPWPWGFWGSFGFQMKMKDWGLLKKCTKMGV